MYIILFIFFNKPQNIQTIFTVTSPDFLDKNGFPHLTNIYENLPLHKFAQQGAHSFEKRCIRPPTFHTKMVSKFSTHE